MFFNLLEIKQASRNLPVTSDMSDEFWKCLTRSSWVVRQNVQQSNRICWPFSVWNDCRKPKMSYEGPQLCQTKWPTRGKKFSRTLIKKLLCGFNLWIFCQIYTDHGICQSRTCTTQHHHIGQEWAICVTFFHLSFENPFCQKGLQSWGKIDSLVPPLFLFLNQHVRGPYQDTDLFPLYLGFLLYLLGFYFSHRL